MFGRPAVETHDAVDERPAVNDAPLRLAVVDYGAGNIASVCKALRHVGADPVIARNAAELQRAAAIVVPGVGHFAATQALDTPWRAAIRAAVDRGIPLLGICLGMQWLFQRSQESPDVPGLGLLEGTCVRIEGAVKIPHVGWNSMTRLREDPLLSGVDDQSVYFTHSYIAPVTDACVASTQYGREFASVISTNRVAGVQWHPEKSGPAGLQLLRNFVDMVRAC